MAVAVSSAYVVVSSEAPESKVRGVSQLTALCSEPDASLQKGLAFWLRMID